MKVTLKQAIHLGTVMVMGAVLAMVHSLLRFRNAEAKGYDLGIFDQAVRQYSLFKAPIVPVKGEDFHLLGDHFHPIIALFAPLYWLWDDPRVLNLGMIALLISSAIPVYLVVRGWFGHLPALLSATALVFSWPFQAIVNWDFHEVAFGVPIMAWIIWCIQRHRWWLAVGLSAVLLTVREDMGATLIAVAAVLAIKRAWWPAIVTAVLGVAGYILAVEIVIPHFSAAGEFGYWEYTALGPTAGAALLFLVTQPWNAVAVLFDHSLKVSLWALHFLPLLLLPLLSPYVLLAAPLLLSRLWNDRLNVWSPIYQYDAILAPILLVAALDVVRRVITTHRLLPGVRFPASWTWVRHAAMVVPVTSLAVTLVGTSFFPGVFPFQRTVTAENWTMTERAEAHHRAAALIPDDVCVEAADTMVPQLTNRTSVGLNGTTAEENLEWLIIDDRAEELGGSDPLTPEEAFQRAERLNFEVVSADDHGLWVLSRDIETATSCTEYLSR